MTTPLLPLPHPPTREAPLTPIEQPTSKQSRKAARKVLRTAKRKEKRKERDRLILQQQKARRRLRKDAQSIANQRLTSMMGKPEEGNDYLQWVKEGNTGSMTAPRLNVASTGAFETARQTAPETMLFHLLSRQAEHLHPCFFGYDATKQQCQVAQESPIWYNYQATLETDVAPNVRHPAAGMPRRWTSDDAALNAMATDMNDAGSDDSDSETELLGAASRPSTSSSSSRPGLRNEGSDTDEDEGRNESRTETKEDLNIPTLTTPICWHRTRAPIQHQHPAFGHRFRTSLARKQCNAAVLHPATYNYTFTRKALPKPVHAVPIYRKNKDNTTRPNITVTLPEGPVQCPVCKGQPGRLGRSGCPACWRSTAILPWTFPPRTMPGTCVVCVVCVAYQEEQFVPFFILAYLTLLRPLPLSFVQTPHRRRTRVRGVKFKIPTIVAVEKERRRKNHKRQKFQARIALRQWQFNEWGRH